MNVDVCAVDRRSLDKIKYIVKCKNWNTTVPQSVFNSFTTVMHETGANIGFIVSKYGLQSGAKQYTRNTNITGFWFGYYTRYVRKTEQETSVLFELIAHRYERHSLIITSNKSLEDWDELFDDTTMTIAAIDRLGHHATIIHCEGESYRRKAAMQNLK